MNVRPAYFLYLLLSIGLTAFGSQEEGETCANILAEWTPQANRIYYDNVAVKGLEEWAVIKGLASGKDLDVIKQEISESLRRYKTILEIGAGNGRIIEWLLKKGTRPTIIAIEQSAVLAGTLREKYRNIETISIIETNILNLVPSFSCDLALWMWSGFLELKPEEKKVALAIVFSILKDKGKLVIDLPRQIQESSLSQSGDFLKVTDEYGTFFAHLISDEALKGMAKEAGFKRERSIIYKTDTNIERISFLLEK